MRPFDRLRPATARRRVVAVLAAALVTLAAPATAQEERPQRVPIADFTPLPPAAETAVPDQVRSLRDELLGEHWDDPGYVTLNWTGVSSYVASIGGHVFLFDAWEIIGAVEDYLPIGREELAALQPEAVLVGHGHFDHAGDLGYVAGSAGAVVVGSGEICDVAIAGAEREGVGTAFTCAITGTMDEPAPGTVQTLRLWEDVEPISILQHIHSAASPPGEDNQPNPFAPIMDPAPYIEHLQDNPEELARFLAQLEEQDQGGTWMYHLSDGDFTLLWGDSSGPVFDTPAVSDALDAFPGCVDVMSNAILGFDQPVSGLQDPRLYVAAAHPKVFLPTHADAWAPVISAGQAQYVDEWDTQMAMLDNPPEVDFLLDPEDYLVERAYRVDDPRWVEPMAGSSCAAAGIEPAPPPAPVEEDDGLPATGGGLVLASLGVAAAALLGRRGKRP